MDWESGETGQTGLRSGTARPDAHAFFGAKLASHLPNWPSFTCSGYQVISWFNSSIRLRNSLTLMNHDDTAR